MNTSSEVVKQLQDAIQKTQSAQNVLDNLIAVHDYEDIATLVLQAAEALLHAASALMQHEDENALQLVESAEDLIDEMYKIIDGDMDG